MDNRNQIIGKIETIYQAYLSQKSDVLFNRATNTLWKQIMDIPCCKVILDAIRAKYPIEESVLQDNSAEEYFSYINDITKDTDSFISYCLHWFDYIKTKVKSPAGYDKRCCWLYSNIRGVNDSMLLFKTDFIRPILDYIILQLKDESYVLYLLDRYKQRIGRFGKLQNVSKKKELDLQKELYLYLFDQGVELYNSVSTGNGEADFVIKCNEKPFVIEVKLYKHGDATDKYSSQLKAYMSHFGA